MTPQYIKDHSDLTACSFLENFIGLKRVKTQPFNRAMYVGNEQQGDTDQTALS